MARYNRQALLAALRGYQAELKVLEQLIEGEQWEELLQKLQRVRQEWQQFPVNQGAP
jgi:prephenate dehydrogenase